jgi:acetylornithine deacetylase/succinyl-diaminopimelate desuccinylase-like protein
MKQFNTYVEENAERFIEELKEFCRQSSISTQDVGLAEMVRARLERLGAEVHLMPVDGGPPVVFAQLGQGERTLLIYDHHDVQSPDPLEEWESPPFEPAIREGKFYLRLG